MSRTVSGAETWSPPDDIAIEDEQITTVIDITAHWPAKLRALSAHASQADAAALRAVFPAAGMHRVEEFMRADHIPDTLNGPLEAGFGGPAPGEIAKQGSQIGLIPPSTAISAPAMPDVYLGDSDFHACGRVELLAAGKAPREPRGLTPAPGGDQLKRARLVLGTRVDAVVRIVFDGVVFHGVSRVRPRSAPCHLRVGAARVRSPRRGSS